MVSSLLLATLSATLALAADQPCAPPVAAAPVAPVPKGLVPKFNVAEATNAFTKAGFSCVPYDFKTGLLCRGKVPGYSDEIALIVPTHFAPASHAHVILHLHGNQWGGTNDDMLKRFRYPQLLAASKRNAVMIVPFSAATVTKENHLEMRDPAKYQLMMDSLMAIIQSAGLAKQAEPKDLTITGHSGAYRPISEIIHHRCYEGKTCYRHRIHEVHLFDASYGEAELYAKWALADGHRLTSTYMPNSPTEAASLEMIQKIGDARKAAGAADSAITPIAPDVSAEVIHALNPAIIQSDVGHEWTFIKFFPIVLRAPN